MTSPALFLLQPPPPWTLRTAKLHSSQTCPSLSTFWDLLSQILPCWGIFVFIPPCPYHPHFSELLIPFLISSTRVDFAFLQWPWRHYFSAPGCLHVSSVEIWGLGSSWLWVCPVYFRMFSSNLGLYPPGASDTPLPSCDSPEGCRHWQSPKSAGRQYCSHVKATGLK
jgi:hypothetical protein